MRRHPAAALLIVLLLFPGCGSPVISPDPAALPLDFAIVWDIAGSTDQGGAGLYFDTPSSKRFAAGSVLVSWWCRSSRTLAGAPGHVNHPPDLLSPESPLAFKVSCPTADSGYADWRQLVAPALGGENALNIQSVAAPFGAITYRLLFAQQAP